ncbi:DUF1360 domain-containing protein [Metabacillus sp. GX 13764]|uniref:DUF1360 domain-containing protein n=1 Tax=Metabacillus kandeliae TaxID=2900151 RepID=UPI001E5F8618|nr:DUF1360 domain-containing protein [Metabacillus kandeliae]MCD7035001.1 DUF1360 domain-containing protein [Metabacillus kandeliae]
MENHWFMLTAFSLAVFRLSRLIVFDKITAFLRSPFHQEIAVKNEAGEEEIYIEIKGKGLQAFIGELISCYWCTGVWCSIILYVFYQAWPQGAEPVIFILALAGLGGIIEACVSKLLD